MRTLAPLLMLAALSACAQNRPGAVTLRTFQARAGDRMLAADADRDGRLSLAEFAGRARDPARAQRRFARLDANRDGMLDRGEINAALARRFARLDANRDGRVTRAERLTLRAERQARRAQTAPPPTPPQG